MNIMVGNSDTVVFVIVAEGDGGGILNQPFSTKAEAEFVLPSLEQDYPEHAPYRVRMYDTSIGELINVAVLH